MKKELIRAVKKGNFQSGPRKCLKKSYAEKEMKEISCLENQGVDLRAKVGDITSFQSPSKEECQFSCQQNAKCIFFTLHNGVST